MTQKAFLFEIVSGLWPTSVHSEVDGESGCLMLGFHPGPLIMIALA